MFSWRENSHYEQSKPALFEHVICENSSTSNTGGCFSNGQSTCGLRSKISVLPAGDGVQVAVGKATPFFCSYFGSSNGWRFSSPGSICIFEDNIAKAS